VAEQTLKDYAIKQRDRIRSEPLREGETSDDRDGRFIKGIESQLGMTWDEVLANKHKPLSEVLQTTARYRESEGMTVPTGPEGMTLRYTGEEVPIQQADARYRQLQDAAVKAGGLSPAASQSLQRQQRQKGRYSYHDYKRDRPYSDPSDPIETREDFSRKAPVEERLRSLPIQQLAIERQAEDYQRQLVAPTEAVPSWVWERSGVDPYSAADPLVREKLRRQGVVSALAIPSSGRKTSVERDVPVNLVGLDGKPLKTKAKLIESADETGAPAQPRLVFSSVDEDGKPVIDPSEEDLFFLGQPDVSVPAYIQNRFDDIDLLPGAESEDTAIGRAKFRARKIKEEYGDKVPGLIIQSWHNKIESSDLSSTGLEPGAALLAKDKEAGRTGAEIAFEPGDEYAPFQWWSGRDLKKEGAGEIRKNQRRDRYMPSETEFESGYSNYQQKAKLSRQAPISRATRDLTQGAVASDLWAGDTGPIDPYAMRVLSPEEQIKSEVLAGRQLATKRREVDYSPEEMLFHEALRAPTELVTKIPAAATSLIRGTLEGLAGLGGYVVSAAVGETKDALLDHVLGEESKQDGPTWRDKFASKSQELGLGFAKSMKQRNDQVTQLMGPAVLSNFANDFDLIGDIFAVAGKEILGLNSSEKTRNAVTIDEVIAESWERGSAFGEEMGVGSVADLVVFAERPIESIRANPAIALMNAVGLGKAMYHTLDPNSRLAKGIQYLSNKFQKAVTVGLDNKRPGVRLALLKAFGDSTASHNANVGAYLDDYQRAAQEASEGAIVKDPDTDFSVISSDETAFLLEHGRRREASELPPLTPEQARELLVRYRKTPEAERPVLPGSQEPSQAGLFDGNERTVSERASGYEPPLSEQRQSVEDAEKILSARTRQGPLGEELSPDEISKLIELEAEQGVRDLDAATAARKAEQLELERVARKERQRIEAAKRNKELAENPQLVRQKAMESALKGERVPDDIAAFLNEEQLAELQGLASKVKENLPKLPPGADASQIITELWYESQVRQPAVLRQDAARILRVLSGIDLSDPVSRHTTQAARSVTRMGEGARGTVYDSIADVNLLAAEVLGSDDAERIINAINKTVPVPKSAGDISAWDYLLKKRDEINKVAPEKLKEVTDIYNKIAAEVKTREAGISAAKADVKKIKDDTSPKGRDKYANDIAAMLPEVGKDGKVLLSEGTTSAINRIIKRSKNKGKGPEIKKGKAKAIAGFKILNEEGWKILNAKGRDELIARLKNQYNVVTDGGASAAAYNVELALGALREQKRLAKQKAVQDGVSSAEKKLSILKAKEEDFLVAKKRWEYVIKDSPETAQQALKGDVKGRGATGDRLARFQRKIDEQFGVSVRADKDKKQSEKLEGLAASGKEPWSATALDDQGRPIVERSGFGPVRTDVGKAIQDIMVGRDSITPAELYRLLKGKMGDDLPIYVQGWRPAADLSSLRGGALDADDVLAMAEGKVALHPDMSAKELAALHPGLVDSFGSVYMAGNYIDGLSAGEVYRRLAEKASKHKPDVVETELLKDSNIDTLLENRIKQKPEEAKELAEFINSDLVNQKGLFDDPFSSANKTVSAEKAATLSFNAQTEVKKQIRGELARKQLSQDVRFEDGQFSLPVVVSDISELAARINEVAREAGVSGSRLHKKAVANALGKKGASKPMSYVEVPASEELIAAMGLKRKKVKELSPADGEIVDVDYNAGIVTIQRPPKKPDAVAKEKTTRAEQKKRPRVDVYLDKDDQILDSIKVGQSVKKGQPLSQGINEIDIGNGKTAKSIYMPKEMKSRLEFYRSYDKVMNNPLGKAGGLYAWMKANMAPRNIASHTYNFTSNVLLNLVATGDIFSPVKLYKNWDDLGRHNAGLPLRSEEALNKWRKGRDVNKPKVMEELNQRLAGIRKEKLVWQALSEARIVKSSIIETEFRKTEKQEKKAKNPGWVGRYFAKLEEAYGVADIPFKTMTGKRQIEKDLDYIEMLGDGEWIERRTSETQKIRIGKNSKGRMVALRLSWGEGTGWIKVGKEASVNRAGFAKVLGRFARYTAGQMYVNYDEVGMLNMLQRKHAGSGVFGILNSPYTSYALASSYIPFVKPGVQGSLLYPNGKIRTNSAKVSRSIAANEFKTWAQRQWVFSAASGNESAEAGPEMLSFLMSQYRLKDRKNMATYMLNPAGPSDLYIIPTGRVGVSGATKGLFNAFDYASRVVLDPLWQSIGLAESKSDLAKMASEMQAKLSAKEKGTPGYKALEKQAQATYAAYAKAILRERGGSLKAVEGLSEFAAITGENFVTAILEAAKKVLDGEVTDAARDVLPLLITPTVSAAIDPFARSLVEEMTRTKRTPSDAALKKRFKDEFKRDPTRAEFQDYKLEALKGRDLSFGDAAANAMTWVANLFVKNRRKGTVEPEVFVEDPASTGRGDLEDALRQGMQELQPFANALNRAFFGSVFYKMDLSGSLINDKIDRLKLSLGEGVNKGLGIKELERQLEALKMSDRPDPEKERRLKLSLKTATQIKGLLKTEREELINTIMEAAKPDLKELLKK